MKAENERVLLRRGTTTNHKHKELARIYKMDLVRDFDENGWYKIRLIHGGLLEAHGLEALKFNSAFYKILIPFYIYGIIVKIIGVLEL